MKTKDQPKLPEHGHGHAEIAARLARPREGNRLRDAVLGGIDGTVTTFAIVAGVHGAGLSSTIIVALGIANVLADGFSMAAGNYSGTKAESDDRTRLRAIEERHINVVPDGEREELRQILATKGLKGRLLEDATAAISSNREAWINIMLAEEYGLSPTDPSPIAAALVTFVAFLAAGIIPLVPYILGVPHPFVAATVVAGGVFFAIGAAKSRWSVIPWWRSGFETLAIGAVAASLAYGVGALFHP